MPAYGVDDNSRIRPLLVDQYGNVMLSTSSLTTSGQKLKQDSDQRLEVAPYTLYGASPFRRYISFDNLALAAGGSTQTLGTVTAGETWQVDQIAVRYDGTVAGVTCIIRQNFTVALPAHCHITVFVNGIWQFFNVNILTDAGTVWEAVLTGATLNDDLRVRIYGRPLR